METPLDHAAVLLTKVWLRLVSPSVMRLLAPLLAVGIVYLATVAWLRAGGSALGRAVRWWCAAVPVATLLAGVLYAVVVQPDDSEVVMELRVAEASGRFPIPPALAAGGALAAAVIGVAAAWRWRQLSAGPAEQRLAAQQLRAAAARWRAPALASAGLPALALFCACAAASIGPVEIPPPVVLPDGRPAAQSPPRAQLWVGTAVGVSRLVAEGDSPRWEGIARPRAPLPSNRTKALDVGPDGTVWVGTALGLAHLGPAGTGRRDQRAGAGWRPLTVANSDLPHWSVLAMALDPRGLAWVATEQGGAVLDAEGRGRAFSASNAPLLHQILDAVYLDRQGRVWFGGAGGVNVYQPAADPFAEGEWPVGFTRYTTDGALPDDLVFTITGDDRGRVWFGTLRGAAVFTPAPGAYGLGAFDTARWQTFTPQNSPLPGPKVHSIVQDRQGRIWLGTEDGIAVLDESQPASSAGHWQRFVASKPAPAGSPAGLPHSWVQAMTVGPDGRVWAGTRGGLAVYDPARPAAGWTAYHAHLLRRWTGLLWPPYWQENILSDDIAALVWG